MKPYLPYMEVDYKDFREITTVLVRKNRDTYISVDNPGPGESSDDD
jgi:hypothetical protein